ncbi:TIGR03088 family PEP-CTERM/XrtA system glycosyltransferase [Rheinheimera sp. MMS21-TC3]|uniref:TIGR03088 family PEP-CTERM/XrtA system glycosyltransferase n=1 Tax=Rheinheimera sp. MMS21-TC3 TaxID=3072790 RepID=UPI0028C474F0|nr:TIGR03088 family PEP-CTERM/XrtA system glycosyltransferase [Rheinheimera sp. MMS21-TC3]WNO60693.1 TIGR03088 family PEP-CTERM/XrtA system glycosyltransferase [Rheinheimera sp. MMS21-TC3]
MTKPVKHIAHIVWHFSTGGLENGMVNLINNLPSQGYKHSIITLTGYDPAFAQRISQSNVQFYNLHKREGHDWKIFPTLNKLLIQLEPDILHSRNLNTLELQLVAWWRKVPLRIHGEHGWDTSDIGGTNKKYQFLRRLLKPFVHRFVCLSSESERYLRQKIAIPANKIQRICNGVDLAKFINATAASLTLPTNIQSSEQPVLFGTVGRLATIKNQAYLLQAFASLMQQHPDFKVKAGLIIVGDGPNRLTLEQLSQALQLSENIVFLGNRADIAAIMQRLDVFVLPSLAEGISNTILEAMASATPVIATDVGGNVDLLPAELHPTNLVEVNNIQQLSKAMLGYLSTETRIKTDGLMCQNHCQQHFSLSAMVKQYQALYQFSGKQG